VLQRVAVQSMVTVAVFDTIPSILVSAPASPANTCVLQCVAVCCSVLQCVAVCCSVLQCVAVCCSVLQITCVLQCVTINACVAVCSQCLGIP